MGTKAADAGDPWGRPLEEVERALGAGGAGLATAEAERRRAIFGPNDPAHARPRPLWLRLIGRFATETLKTLFYRLAARASRRRR